MKFNSTLSVVHIGDASLQGSQANFLFHAYNFSFVCFTLETSSGSASAMLEPSK